MTRTDFYSLHDPKHAQWILMTEQVSCFRTTVVQATPLMETVQLITPFKDQHLQEVRPEQEQEA